MYLTCLAVIDAYHVGVDNFSVSVHRLAMKNSGYISFLLYDRSQLCTQVSKLYASFEVDSVQCLQLGMWGKQSINY